MNPSLPAGALGMVAALGLFGAQPSATAQGTPAQPPAATAEKRVSLNIKELPLRSALELVYSGSGVQYAVDPNVPNVPITVNVSDWFIGSAARLLVRLARSFVPTLVLERINGVCHFRLDPDAGRRAPDGELNTTAGGEEKRVSLKVRDTPLRQVLEILFAGTGLQYAVDPAVPNPPITLDVADQSVTSAARLVVRLAGSFVPGLTIVREGNVLLIRISQEIAASRATPGADGTSTWKLPLQYLTAERAVEHLRQASPSGIEALYAVPDGNHVIARGSTGALDELKSILSVLDTPTPMGELRVGITAPGPSGRPIALESTALFLSGKELTIDDRARRPNGLDRMKVRARVIARQSGGYLVETDWDLSVAVAGGAKGPVELMKKLSTSSTSAPGETVTIAEVSTASWGGTGMVKLWVRVVPSLRGAVTRPAGAGFGAGPRPPLPPPPPPK
jgi:hypothetical protein